MKYSMPLPDEPSRLARQTVITRGKFAGSSGSSPAKPQPAGLQLLDDVVVDALAGRGRLVGEVERVAVEGRVRRASSPSATPAASVSANARPRNRPRPSGLASSSAPKLS